MNNAELLFPLQHLAAKCLKHKLSKVTPGAAAHPLCLPITLETGSFQMLLCKKMKQDAAMLA